MFIRFRDVTKRFARADRTELTAVADVTLDVARGEFVTLVGPSGCGKSTLLNLTAGLYGPSAGTVLYDGAPVVGINPRVGYMTQTDHLLPWRDVASNIAVPLEIRGLRRGEIRARVEQLMAMVGLRGFERSYPNQISGGMRKRTVLARLLACGAETLLMDEPFGALDAQMRLTLQVELKRLVGGGTTVLFVTHDLDEAVALGDRCVVFAGRPGRIARVMDVPLPKSRDLRRLRGDPDYNAACATLWSELMAEPAPG